MQEEILFKEEEKRYTLFPIRYPDIWDMHDKQESAFWRASEIDLSNDRWDDLTDNEKYFIINTLAFFAASDGIVNENLAVDFSNKINLLEVKIFYQFQIMMENIHSRVYSELIEKYIQNEEEKRKLFNAIEEIPIIKKKAEWALRYIDEGSFVERLVAFALVEGVFFSTSFASIFWLKEQKKLPGLAHANELISRDENFHYQFAVYLYNNYITNKLDINNLTQIIEEAERIEIEFATTGLPVSLLGINKESMVKYVKYVVANVKNDFGIPTQIPECPFQFMEKIAASRQTNMFERRVSEYRKPSDTTISFNEDF